VYCTKRSKKKCVLYKKIKEEVCIEQNDQRKDVHCTKRSKKICVLNRNAHYTHLNTSIDRLGVFFPKEIHWKQMDWTSQRSVPLTKRDILYKMIDRSELYVA
jgi:hypothetical protein